MPTRLNALLGDYPHTRAVKTGALADDAAAFDFSAITPVHSGFAAMVRGLEFELSELAVVTALQALEFRKPIVVLPVVLSARFQRDRLIALASRNVKPRDLIGQAVGVRSFTQTTGMWVRAALAEDHGIGIESVRWRTRDGAHVIEYSDPPFVEHETSEKSLPEQLRDGDIIAAIMGADLPEGDPAFVRVIADHAAADARAFARDGFMPINHMLVASAEAVASKPDAIRAAYALLKRAAAEAPPTNKPSPARFGAAAVTAPLQYAIEEAARQRLLTRAPRAEDVLAPARDLLGE